MLLPLEQKWYSNLQALKNVNYFLTFLYNFHNFIIVFAHCILVPMLCDFLRKNPTDFQSILPKYFYSGSFVVITKN